MADLKISQLTDGGASQATDEYVVARSGSNFRIDGASVAAAATSVGTLSSLTVSGDLTVRTNKLKVDSTGVGIGTASPGFTAHAVGAVTGTYTTSTSQVVASIQNLPASLGSGVNSSFLRLQTSPDGGSSNPIVHLGVVAESYGSNLASFVVQTRDTGGITERLRVDSSGNLGLGVTPSAPLHVKAANNEIMRLQSSDATTGSLYFTFYDSADAEKAYIGYGSGANDDFLFVQRENAAMAFFTNGTERARITSGGTLLVGKTASDATIVGAEIRANGSIVATRSESDNTTSTFDVYSTGAAAYRFYVGMGGTVYATNTTISAISDARLKENVRDLDVGLDAILALKPRTFDWKEGKGKDKKNDRGFIAQEFEEVFPDLIDEWKDPAPEGEEPYRSVRADLIPVLVKAIQELDAKNKALEARLEALEA